MTTVTLNLPDSVVQRAARMAQVLDRSVEEVLTATLTNNLLDVEDAPAEIQVELLQMTWLSDQQLMAIAQSRMTEAEQKQLASLSKRQTCDSINDEERQTLQSLRQRYGWITLRKARAFALLSLRAGKPLLSEPVIK